MIDLKNYATSESQGQKLSKTDYLDIAVCGEMQPDGSLTPSVEALLFKARELAEPDNVKVSLLVYGFRIARKARSLFRFGADRVFVYDDALFQPANPDVLGAVFAHFFENYKPAVVLFADTPEGWTALQSAAGRTGVSVAERPSAFTIRSNKDLVFEQPEFSRVADTRPQLVLLAADHFPQAQPDDGRKGELILCELPEALR